MMGRNKPFTICHFTFVIRRFNLEVQQNFVVLRPIRGEKFIERATAKRFLLAPAERNISRSREHSVETLRSAGARATEFITLSINISLLRSETRATVALQLESTINNLLHFQVESASDKWFLIQISSLIQPSSTTTS